VRHLISQLATDALHRSDATPNAEAILRSPGLFFFLRAVLDHSGFAPENLIPQDWASRGHLC
jgi:hypothetical protein